MLQDEKIIIVPYDPDWPRKFEKEKKLIEKTLGSYITGGVHHIGSTAIPGLSAKPIIDILVGVESLEISKSCIDLLSKIQYHYFPYKTESEHWLCKPSPTHREYHLHLIPTNHKDFKAKLVFRDYLRSHQKVRNAYGKLKIKLAEQFGNDREAYTEAKTEFVKSILAKAL